MESKFKFSEDFIKSSILNVVFLNTGKRIVFINDAASSNIGMSIDKAKGLSVEDFFNKFFEKTGESVHICQEKITFQVLKRNGKTYKVFCFPINIGKEVVGFVLLFTDITKEEETRSKLEEETILLNRIIEFTPDMLFAVDKNGKVIIWNETAERMTGVRKKDILGKGNYEYAIPIYGRRRPLLVDFVLKEKMPDNNLYFSVEKHNCVIVGFTDKAVLRGEKKILWGKASCFYGEKGSLLGAIEIVRDVTKMKQMEHQLRYLSERDPLTGVFNRRQFTLLLQREIEHCKRNNTPLTLFYIDVDNLKEINDEFGHLEGDNFLKNIARVFMKGLRKVDIAARVGGDEFVIIAPSLGKEDAEKLINRLRGMLKTISEKKKYNMDFSYGLFEFEPTNTISINDMLAIADKRMYEMKKSKKAKT